MPMVEELKALKVEYEKAVGEPFPAPAAPAKKKKAVGERTCEAIRGDVMA
eukprot:COSAG06_NODE_19678_length_827_cov_1.157967_1_plen_50_part_00